MHSSQYLILTPVTSYCETDDDKQHEVVICLQTLEANSGNSRIGPQEDDGDGYAKKRESFCREFGHFVGIMSTGYPAWCRKTTSLIAWSREEGEKSSSRVMPGGVLREVGEVYSSETQIRLLGNRSSRGPAFQLCRSQLLHNEPSKGK